MRLRKPQALLLAAVIAGGSALAACGGGGASDSTLAPVTDAPSTSVEATTTTEAAPGVPTLAPGAPLPSLVPFSKDDHADQKEPEVMVGEISIPAIGLTNQTMYLGYSNHTYDRGVGLWPGAPKPGEAGNVVLGGHRTSGPKPFRRLDELKAGDEVIITTPDGTFVYVIEGVGVYPNNKETAALVLGQTSSAKLTMFACHPPGKVTHRIVAFANYSRKISA